MPDFKKLTLDTVAGGCLPEKFLQCQAQVLKNIKDPETDAKPRKILLEVTYSVKEGKEGQRHEMSVSAIAKTKLRPKGAESSFAFISTKGGEIKGFTHDVRQQDLEDERRAQEEEKDEGPDVLPMDQRRETSGS